MRFIIVGVVGILMIAVIGLIITFTREGAVVKSGAISKGVSYVKNDTWSTSASKINGSCRVDKSLNSTNLADFRVKSTNSDGKIFLIVTQGNIEKKLELTESFNGEVDMNDFKAGRIRLRLEFDQATDLKVSVSWI